MTTTSVRREQKESSPDMREAILVAARDLLADGGVAGLSMRQIADRVGVTATAIYHYFDGKQQIVDQVVLSAFERFGAYLEEAMESYPSGSVARIHALGEAYIRFAFENDAYFRVIFSIQPQSCSALAEIPEGGGYNLLRKAVTEAMEAGTIRNVSGTPEAEGGAGSYADLVSMYLWSLAHGVVTLTMCGAGPGCEGAGRSDAVELLRAFAPMVEHGIEWRESGKGENEEREERTDCE